jgi:hypothetical protein
MPGALCSHRYFSRFVGVLMMTASAVAMGARLELSVVPPSAAASGADANPLQRAVDQLAAAHKAGQLIDGAIVHIAAGTYRLVAPMRLTEDCSGTAAAPVVFEGPPQGYSLINGARVITGFEEVRDVQALARLPEAARSHVLRVDLKRLGITDWGTFARQGQSLPMKPSTLEVFYRGAPMPLARWPNTGYAQIGQLPDGENGSTFGISGGHFSAWAQEPALLAVGYWQHDWADESVEIDKVDPAKGVLTVRGGKPIYGMKAAQRIFLQNAMSELDTPGEWYLDRATSMLYFWPPAPLRDGDVEVSILDSVLVTQGASHVHFKNLGFEAVRGDAVSINGGTDVVIENSLVRNAGERGVVMAGVAHRVVDSDIYNTGQGGIIMYGGDRQTLAPAGLAADGNRIYLYARLVRAYRPAIQINGVGNRARANVISQAPHAAIIFYGNDHLIELNEISDVLLEAGDSGAIYAGNDWTARGTTIRYNYLHDLHGPGLYGSRGVYLDEMNSGTTIDSNLFARVDHAVFIGGGRDDLVQNNVFVDSSPAMHLDERGLTWQGAKVADPNGLFRKALAAVPYDKPPYTTRYPTLATMLKDNPGQPRGDRAVRNIVIDGKPFDLQDNAAADLQVDQLFTDHDVQFVAGVAPAARKRPLDFRIAPQSTAVAHGFVPLPLMEMECATGHWAKSQYQQVVPCPAPSADPPGH